MGQGGGHGAGEQACSEQAIQAIGWPPGCESASWLAGSTCEQAGWRTGFLASLGTASTPSHVRPDLLLKLLISLSKCGNLAPFPGGSKNVLPGGSKKSVPGGSKNLYPAGEKVRSPRRGAA